MVQSQAATFTDRLAVAARILIAPVTLHAVVERRIIESSSMTIRTGIRRARVRIVCCVPRARVSECSMACCTRRHTAPAAIVEALERGSGRREEINQASGKDGDDGNS
jgi:hypothetical protein